MKEKRTTIYAELGTGPVSVEPYVSAGHFELEREKIFRRVWLNVGRAEEMPRAGDYLVKEIAVLKASVLLVRGGDGAIRSFYNVCRHRGNKLVRSCAGSAAVFSCGFHGWSYDLAGQLVYVPDQEEFFAFEKSEHGLIPLATEVWQGFIFVKFDASDGEGLLEYLGEASEAFRGYPFADMLQVGAYLAEVNANWKVATDIGKELYHVPFVHRRSIPDSHTGKGNPFGHFRTIRLYRYHCSASADINPEHRPTPAEALAFKYGSTVLQGAEEERALPPGLNPERSANWAFDVHIVFPNLTILLGNGWYVMHRFWPVAVDRTLWESCLHMRRAKNAGERISQEFSKVLTRDLLREDLVTVENNHAALASGALRHMEFSDQEVMLRHGYRVVEHFVGRR